MAITSLPYDQFAKFKKKQLVKSLKFSANWTYLWYGGPLNKGFEDDVDNIYEGAVVLIASEKFGSDGKRTISLKQHNFV